MGEIKDFPITHRERIKNEQGIMSVECIVSGRWLRFDSTSKNLNGEDIVHVDVMAMHTVGEKDRKICELMISLQELEQVMKKIQREL